MKRTIVNRYQSREHRPVAIGIDLGTQGVEVTVADAVTLEPLEGGREEHRYPTYEVEGEPGRKMQNPADWRSGLEAVFAKLQAKELMADKLVVAVGISGQMHALVLLDNENRPVDLSSLWNCNSAIRYGRQLSDEFGVKIDGRLTISHLLKNAAERPAWFRRHVARWTTPAGFLGLLFSAEHALGIGEASGTGMVDLDCGTYCPLRKERIRRALGAAANYSLAGPPIRRIGEPLRIRQAHARRWGFKVPEAGAVLAPPEGDQPALCIGNAVYRPGQAALNVGTSIVIDYLSSGRPDDPGRTIDYFFDACGTKLNMGLAANGLQVTDRVAREYAESHRLDSLGEARRQLDDLANQHALPDGLFVDFDSAESFLGITQPLKKGINWNVDAGWGERWHNARILTGVLLRLRLKSLSAGGTGPQELVAGGDAAGDKALMQTWANALQVPIRVPALPMGACTLGAIRLALAAEEAAHSGADLDVSEVLDELTESAGEFAVYRPDTAQEPVYQRYEEMLLQAVKH